MNPELFEAYKNTTYRVYLTLGEIEIRIGVMNLLLQEFLLSNNVESWAFITACNPYSVLQNADANTFLNTQLEAYLLEKQYLFFKGVGVGDDDRVCSACFEKLVMRNRLGTFVFRVHPGVQHDLGGLGFKQIGIRTDTGVATETFEYHGKMRNQRTGRGPWGRRSDLSTHPRDPRRATSF